MVDTLDTEFHTLMATQLTALRQYKENSLKQSKRPLWMHVLSIEKIIAKVEIRVWSWSIIAVKICCESECSGCRVAWLAPGENVGSALDTCLGLFLGQAGDLLPWITVHRWSLHSQPTHQAKCTLLSQTKLFPSKLRYKFLFLTARTILKVTYSFLKDNCWLSGQLYHQDLFTLPQFSSIGSENYTTTSQIIKLKFRVS